MRGNETGLEDCFHNDPVPLMRMVLIAFGASPLALAGVVGNGLLASFFGTAERRRTPTLYLTHMAAMDAAICATYILIFGGDAVAMYWEVGWLALAVAFATLPLLLLSRVVQLASTYIVIAAATERWLLIYQGESAFLRRLRGVVTRRRGLIIGVIFGVSVLLRLPLLFSVKYGFYEDCESLMGRVGVEPTEFGFNNYVNYIYDFYGVTFIGTFFPFPTLILLNILVIYGLKQRKKKSSKHDSRKSVRFRVFSSMSGGLRDSSVRKLTNGDASPIPAVRGAVDEESDAAEDPVSAPLAASLLASAVIKQEEAGVAECRKEVDTRRQAEAEAASVRNATLTLVAIASAYLVCNSLSFAVSLLERLPGQPFLWLRDEEGRQIARTDLYIITTDVVSFLYMFNSFMRIGINIRFNAAVRAALFAKAQPRPRRP